MNTETAISTALLAPWRSTRGGLHRFGLALAALAIATAAAFAVIYRDGDEGTVIGLASLVAFALAFFNALILAPTLLLAVDARQLCVPSMQRSALLGMVSYIVLEITLVGLLFGLSLGHVATVITIAALGAVGGLFWGLSPRYVSIFLGFSPTAFNAIHPFAHLPSPGQHAFIPLLCSMVLLATLGSTACWWREIHADSPYKQGFARPLVAAFRANARLNRYGMAGRVANSSSRILQQPNWLQPRADLRKVGPRFVVRTLRVAFGGFYLPQTLGSSLAKAALFGSALLIMPSLMYLNHLNHDGRSTDHLWLMLIAGMLGWASMFAGALFALTIPASFQQRWSRTNGELPLLALLPNLGDGAALRKCLLMAGLGIPLIMMGGLLILILTAAWYFHFAALSTSFLLFAQLGSAACMTVLMLTTFGNTELPRWGKVMLLTIFLMLNSLSTVMPLTAAGSDPWRYSNDVFLVILAGWAILGVILWWLGRRAWRGMQKRPHPFVMN